MIPLLRAFAWLRWRLFFNAFRGSKRRDPLERASRAASAVIPVVLTIVFIPALIASGVLGFLGGWSLGQGGESALPVSTILRILLAAFTWAAVLAPAIRSIKGSGADFARFLLLPIPRRLLHLSEMVSGLADPWIAIIVPAILFLPAGMAASGAIVGAAVAFAAGLGLLGTLLALESCVTGALGLLYRNRRRGEMVSLVVLLALSFSGFIPMLVDLQVEGRHGSKRDRAAARAAAPKTLTETSSGNAPRATDGLPLPLRIVPSELYATSVTRVVGGNLPAGGAALAGLLLLGTALYSLSWTAYRRLVDSPEVGSRRRSEAVVDAATRKFPGLGASASSVAFITIKSIRRSVQGKMTIYFSPVTLIFVFFMFSRFMTKYGSRMELGYAGPALAYMGGVILLLSYQKLMLNQFAIDGAGLTLELLLPLSEADLILGKAAGIALLYGGTGLLSVAAAALFAPDPSPWLWLAALLGGISGFVLFVPVAAILAALFPKPANLGRFGSSGQPNGLAGLVGFALTPLVFAPPAILSLASVVLLERPFLAPLLVGVWALLAAAISSQLFRLATRIIKSRRENLALVAQGR